MNHEADNFDSTPEGREIIALLERHAPPPPDTHAASRAVLQRLHEQHPRGRIISMRWIGPLVGAAAAVVLAFMIFNPPETTQPENQPVVSDNDPAPEITRQYTARPEHVPPALTAVVRGTAGNDVLISAGLKDGLRVGDMLQGPGGSTARVTAAGIFEARVSISGPTPARGAEMRAETPTPAMKRAARFAEVGGDPGAFLEFGAVLGALPMADARLLGISDGKALVVEESIPAIMRDADQPASPTLAARIGLRAGDVIIEVNGASVRALNDFTAALGWSLQPQVLHVRVIRNGRELELKLS